LFLESASRSSIFYPHAEQACFDAADSGADAGAGVGSAPPGSARLSRKSTARDHQALESDGRMIEQIVPSNHPLEPVFVQQEPSVELAPAPPSVTPAFALMPPSPAQTPDFRSSTSNPTSAYMAAVPAQLLAAVTAPVLASLPSTSRPALSNRASSPQPTMCVRHVEVPQPERSVLENTGLSDLSSLHTAILPGSSATSIACYASPAEAHEPNVACYTAPPMKEKPQAAPTRTFPTTSSPYKLLEKPVEHWDEADVATWLAFLSRTPDDIAELVFEHAISGPVLLSLSDEDLAGLDIVKFGHRRLLVLAARELRGRLDISQPLHAVPRSPIPSSVEQLADGAMTPAVTATSVPMVNMLAARPSSPVLRTGSPVLRVPLTSHYPPAKVIVQSSSVPTPWQSGRSGSPFPQVRSASPCHATLSPCSSTGLIATYNANMGVIGTPSPACREAAICNGGHLPCPGHIIEPSPVQKARLGHILSASKAVPLASLEQA